MSPSSIVQKSLRTIAMFEVYGMGGVLTKEAEVEQTPVAPPPSIEVSEKPKIEIEETTELEELFPEEEREKFPFIDALEEISGRDLYRQCLQILELLKGKA